jgi:hypothetical protein
MKTPQEWREYLDTLPEPMVGPSPWSKKGAMKGEDAYQLAGELTAKAMLIVADEDPSLLDIPDTITDGYRRASYDAAWKAAEARYPGLDDWLGGITGNMFGWANGVVRYIHDKPPVGNPAIVTISVGEREKTS